MTLRTRDRHNCDSSEFDQSAAGPSDHDQPHAIKKVWYVTMAFPVPSEAFASVEINEMLRRRINVSVKSIRHRRSDCTEVAEQQRVQQVPAQHADWRSPIRGLWLAGMQPVLALRLWWKLCTTLANQPAVLLACLFWSLRCFELHAAAQREKPDAVHLYWGHVPAMLGWLLLESRTVDSPTELVLTTSLSAYDLEMAIPLSFDVAKNCDGIRTWASANSDPIQSQGISSERIQLVHQGIDIERFVCERSAKKSAKMNRLIFVGRLIPEKGVELVVELVRQLKPVFPDIDLVIGGNGPLHESVLQQVDEFGLRDHVQVRGHLSHAHIARELQQAQLFLLPSRHSAERLPNVVKEAAAAGCCCLTTPTPGIDLLVRDGVSGKILPADQVQAWVDAVTDLLNDPGSTRRMAEEAKRRVVEHFDVAVTASELIVWWERLSAEATAAKRVST